VSEEKLSRPSGRHLAMMVEDLTETAHRKTRDYALLCALTELQERRAADLTPEVIEALRSLRNWRGISQLDVAAIDAVLRSNGSTK
jgi:hypothetical protein